MAAGLVRPLGSLFVTADVIQEYDSNVTGAETDLVNVQDSQIEIADAGEHIIGVLMEDVTSASTNAQVNVTPGLQVIMDNDNDSATFAATDVGEFFDITGGTGAQIVNTDSKAAAQTTGSSGQLVCLEYNPQGFGYDADTSVGRYMIKEHQLFGGSAV